MEIRKTSGTDAPARPTMSPVVKKRLNAGAICATPGMITPNRPSCPRLSDGLLDVPAGLGAGLGGGPEGVGMAATVLALSVPADEVEERPVEFGRVLPDAGVTALGRGPFRARDSLVDPPRQRDGDEDVLLAGQHQGWHADVTETVGGVVVLDHRELRQVRVHRLVHVPHRGLELRELGTALGEERDGE